MKASELTQLANQSLFSPNHSAIITCIKLYIKRNEYNYNFNDHKRGRGNGTFTRLQDQRAWPGQCSMHM